MENSNYFFWAGRKIISNRETEKNKRIFCTHTRNKISAGSLSAKTKGLICETFECYSFVIFSDFPLLSTAPLWYRRKAKWLLTACIWTMWDEQGAIDSTFILFSRKITTVQSSRWPRACLCAWIECLTMFQNGRSHTKSSFHHSKKSLVRGNVCALCERNESQTEYQLIARVVVWLFHSVAQYQWVEI